jgi:hypothetical protein
MNNKKKSQLILVIVMLLLAVLTIFFVVKIYLGLFEVDKKNKIVKEKENMSQAKPEKKEQQEVISVSGLIAEISTSSLKIQLGEVYKYLGDELTLPLDGNVKYFAVKLEEKKINEELNRIEPVSSEVVLGDFKKDDLVKVVFEKDREGKVVKTISLTKLPKEKMPPMDPFSLH